MVQLGLDTPGLLPAWLQIAGGADAIATSICLRPILLHAISGDGLDYLEIDIRTWFENAVKSNQKAILAMCNSWFRCDDTDDEAAVFANLLRGFNAETALFFHRVTTRRCSWTCTVDERAITSWLLDKAPELASYIDPLMLAAR